MKSKQFYYYFIDDSNFKSEYLINDLYSKVNQTYKRKIASVIGPTNENAEEINLNVQEDINIIKIDEEAFSNCNSLKRIIVPNTIIFVEKSSFPLHTQIIVNNEEYSVDEYLKFISKNNISKLISEIRLILPWLNEYRKIIKIIKKSKTTYEAEKMLFHFLNKKIKMNEYDSKKAVTLILSLKLKFIVSTNRDQLIRKLNEVELEL